MSLRISGEVDKGVSSTIELNGTKLKSEYLHGEKIMPVGPPFGCMLWDKCWFLHVFTKLTSELQLFLQTLRVHNYLGFL